MPFPNRCRAAEAYHHARIGCVAVANYQRPNVAKPGLVGCRLTSHHPTRSPQLQRAIALGMRKQFVKLAKPRIICLSFYFYCLYHVVRSA